MIELLGGNDVYEKLYSELLKTRIIYINQPIDDDIIDRVAMQIILKNLEEENITKDKLEPLTIYLNTDGGDVIATNYLIDIMHNSRIPIHVRVLGKACSAGLLITIAAKHRMASKESVFLLHDGSYMLSDSSSKARDTMEFLDALEEKVDGLIMERTNLTEEEYNKIKRKELYCFGEEALEKGFVDQLI